MALYIQKIEEHQLEKLEIKQELRYNKQNQQQLRGQIVKFLETQKESIELLRKLTYQIYDKEVACKAVLIATTILSTIFAFFSFGSSLIAGGITAIATKLAFQSQIKQLERSKCSCSEKIEQMKSMIREIYGQLSTLGDEEVRLENQIQNLEQEDTKIFKKMIIQ